MAFAVEKTRRANRRLPCSHSQGTRQGQSLARRGGQPANPCPKRNFRRKGVVSLPGLAMFVGNGRCRRCATRIQRWSNLSVTINRPIGIQVLSALLTIYTMAGFLLAIRTTIERDDRYQWWLIAAAAAAFALASGVATQAVWGVQKRAPLLLITCGALGSALCLALPAAVPDAALAAGMWRAAIQGAVLIFAFLALAAWYVRNVIRARARV